VDPAVLADLLETLLLADSVAVLDSAEEALVDASVLDPSELELEPLPSDEAAVEVWVGDPLDWREEDSEELESEELESEELDPELELPFEEEDPDDDDDDDEDDEDDEDDDDEDEDEGSAEETEEDALEVELVPEEDEDDELAEQVKSKAGVVLKVSPTIPKLGLDPASYKVYQKTLVFPNNEHPTSSQ
jgi:cobalamin biosynthesis protein CobT